MPSSKEPSHCWRWRKVQWFEDREKNLPKIRFGFKKIEEEMKEHGLLLAAEGRPSSAKSERVPQVHQLPPLPTGLELVFIHSLCHISKFIHPLWVWPLTPGVYFKDSIAESCRFLSGEQAAISAVLTWLRVISRKKRRPKGSPKPQQFCKSLVD